MEATDRDRCLPRNEGMAQKPQLRSQPSATFTYDHGALAAGRGRLSRSKEGTTVSGFLPSVTGVRSAPVVGSTATAPVSEAPNGATRSTSGRAAASSSP